MKYFHNIELQDSKITGLIVDPLSTDPSFDQTDAGRIYFNSSTQTLRLNNGQEYIDVSIPANFNNLIATLGSNWITVNYAFNPAPFNALDNVSGLDANSSLFDVISQLDHAISQTGGSSLLTLSDVVETTTLVAGNILYFNGDNFTFADIDTLIANYGNITYLGLKDVDASDVADGDVFFFNAASQKFKAGSMVYTQEDFQNTTSHTITHTLGVKYCGVTIINRSNDTLITNATVVFTDINQIDITLPAAAPIYVVLVATPALT